MKPVFLLLMTAAAAASQTTPLARGAQRMEITVERLDSHRWRAVDPASVFAAGDRLRFRFQTSFNGYLFVMNQGTSGDYTLLFPRHDTGSNNRIETGREYVLPATEGAFRVAGPPGQDVMYWMVSPTDLRSPPLPARPAAPAPSLTPRCDDTVLRARGHCVDPSAGPRRIRPSEPVPENLAAAGGDTSRELVFMKQQNKAVISSPAPLTGPVIYEFRLSHR